MPRPPRRRAREAGAEARRQQGLTLAAATLEAARRAAHGDVVDLDGSATWYRIAGPGSGPPVVLVHGFSVPSWIWDPTAEALAAAGFRVLRYDLLGRGWSDRPRRVYDADLFDSQLAGLVDALGLDRFALIGLSMGGNIACTYVGRRAERVDKLVLIDPAGLHQDPPVVPPALTAPVLGDLVVGLTGRRLLTRGLAKDLRDPDLLASYLARYGEQLRYPGVKRALLSTLRSGMLDRREVAFRTAGERGVETLLIWGSDDQTVPFALHDKVMSLIPHARLLVIDGAGHIPHYERPDLVSPAIVEFLRA